MTGPCSSRQIVVPHSRWSAPLGHVLVWCCLLASGSGCGLDDVGPGSRFVGGRCTVDRDCDQLCILDAPFPGGYCSVRCRKDSDCPSGSACIPEAGSSGLCLAVCGAGAECVNYGTPYTCRRESTLSGATRSDGAPGAQVCIGP